MAGSGTRGIFVSYRREDAGHVAGRLADKLTERFGTSSVFIDVDSIEPGIDFAEAIQLAIARCDVLLALIGREWATMVDERGRRRLDDPDDYVVLELRAALERDIRVIPVLVDGAEVPSQNSLPPSLRPLVRRNAVRLDYETFRSDAAWLVQRLGELLSAAGSEATPAQEALPERTESADRRPSAGRAAAVEADPSPPAVRDVNAEKPRLPRGAGPRSAPGLTRRAWSKLRGTLTAGSRRTRPRKAAAETTHYPEPAIERAGRQELQPAEDRSPPPHILPDDPAPRCPEGSAVDSTRPGDRVECSVFAPPMVSPGSAFLIQVFAHISGRAHEAIDRAREFDADSARRAIKTLESSVSRGTRLAFWLTMPGLRVDDPVQSMVWWGTTESVQFGVSVPERRRPGGVMGTITISQDSIPIGHIKFILTVAASLPARQVRPARSVSAVGEAAKRYEMAFVSYASADRAKVLERVQILPMFGIQTFQDVLDLAPGQRWEQSLYRHIDESDIVLLFWSTAAKRSKWVRKEVQYALDRKHSNEYALPEIGPVIIEGPPVPPPWKELAHLHFNDPTIYFMNR
jgi:hypothetical protein